MEGLYPENEKAYGDLEPFYCEAQKDYISINCSYSNLKYFFLYTHCILQLADV